MQWDTTATNDSKGVMPSETERLHVRIANRMSDSLASVEGGVTHPPTNTSDETRSADGDAPRLVGLESERVPRTAGDPTEPHELRGAGSEPAESLSLNSGGADD